MTSHSKTYIERYPFKRPKPFTCHSPAVWMAEPSIHKNLHLFDSHSCYSWIVYPFTNRYACPLERLIRCTSQFSNGLSVHQKVINCNTYHIPKWLISSQTAALTSYWMVNPFTNRHICPLSSGICKMINPAIRINS